MMILKSQMIGKMGNYLDLDGQFVECLALVGKQV